MKFSSDTLLLSTKLKIPVPRKNYIIRKALFEKLSKCSDMGVIFINGGAGTGKTTLLSSFVKEKGLKNVCWISMDSSNANVYSFWLYFTAAVNVFWEDDSFLSLMRSNEDASHMETFLTLLINRLWNEEDYYMVIDDVHCLKDKMLLKTLEYFIGAMPANFHIFMLSREEQPIYLGPLAVSGRLLYLDSQQMQLTAEEGIAFLKDTLGFKGSKEDFERINNYAEGWIGGLQLAAAAGKVSGQLLRSEGGIASEYLTREIFEALSGEEQNFLVGTGFLPYFDGEICAVLLQDFTKADFEHMLEGLIRKNLFIICVDEENGIYRYHNILSDYLTQKFSEYSEELRIELHGRAADIYRVRTDLEEALSEYYKAGDYDNILKVAEDMGGKMEAWSYLDKIPEDLLFRNADLAAQCLMYNLGNLNIERCRLLYNKFKEFFGDSDTFHIVQFAEAYLVQNDGILPKYHSITLERINNLPFGPVAKAMIMVENSAALVERMCYQEAADCIERAIHICGNTNVFVEFFAYNQLAQVYEETGHLNASLTCYARSKELFQYPSMMSGTGVNYYFGLAGVYLRRMELLKAEDTLNQVKTFMGDYHLRADIMEVTLAYHLAEMKFLSGDKKGGALAVEEILHQYPRLSVLTLGRLVHELDCADKLSAELSSNFLKELKEAENYRDQPFMRLLMARLLFRKGEKDEAFLEVDGIMAFSRMHQNKIRLIEAELLKLYMLLQSEEQGSNRREMSNLLREAIHYACEDRILMPFYLDREVLLPLLKGFYEKAVKEKDIISSFEMNFLCDTLSICGLRTAVPKEADTLSLRELEVLRELALGITNREIADRLCISQATVKTHIISIYSKFGVSSRVMAVDMGKRKGLLL